MGTNLGWEGNKFVVPTGDLSQQNQVSWRGLNDIVKRIQTTECTQFTFTLSLGLGLGLDYLCNVLESYSLYS